ncbi:MAG TPA: BON domain-containing protein [Thermoanaerobaculia bacterium]|nr:BON domain-containing protein [Thermoanaerobaculia bacterium]HXT51096.1 BON domain-containing protein [Thermoanaerobaculia bacterium]
MRSSIATALAITLAAGLAGGCKRSDTEHAEAQARKAGDEATAALERAGKEVEQGAEQLAAQAKPLLDDATLTAKVKAKLAADPEVTAYAIDVDTLEGVVTLSGRVESATESAEAEKLARGTEGVKSVVNRLTVGTAPVPGSSPAP